jgi:hypothetical protein
VLGKSYPPLLAQNGPQTICWVLASAIADVKGFHASYHFVPLQSSLMESVFNAVSLVLFAAAAVTFIAMVREVLPHLAAEDRTPLQGAGGSSIRRLRVRDRALARAWKVHVDLFPKSRKRQLFAVLLIAAALSVFGYPLWVALK